MKKSIIHIFLKHAKKKRTAKVSRDSRKILMSNVVTGVQWNSFNDNFGNCRTSSFSASPTAPRQFVRREKVIVADENPDKISRTKSMYRTDLLRAWLSSIAWKFVPLDPVQV